MGAKVGKIIVFLSATVEVCLLKAGNYGSDIIFVVYIFFPVSHPFPRFGAGGKGCPFLLRRGLVKAFRPSCNAISVPVKPTIWSSLN